MMDKTMGVTSMKWFTLLLMLGSGAVSAACPDYFNVEMRELNSTQRHNLCQLTEGKVVLGTVQHEKIGTKLAELKEQGKIAGCKGTGSCCGEEKKEAQDKQKACCADKK